MLVHQLAKALVYYQQLVVHDNQTQRRHQGGNEELIRCPQWAAVL